MAAALAVVGAACSGGTVEAVQEITTAPPTTAELTTVAPTIAAPTIAAPTTVAPTSTVPTTTTTVPTTPPPRQPVVLGFGGDTSFTNGLEQRDPFGEVIELLSAPDLMVVNLETAVADQGVGRPPVDKRFLFRSPPAALDLLVDAGVDVVALANNHTLDFGVPALEQTLDEIDARALERVGAGLDPAEAYEPLIVNVGEWTVGLVSFSRVPCDWSASGENVRPQVAWACPPFQDLAEAAVQSALDAADVTVVMVHGGEEGVLCPSRFMVDLRRRWAEMGVDAVIDGHPHVLQGVTQFGQTLVAHSLGNFAFPSARGITGNSAIVQLTITEDGTELSVVPVRSNAGVLAVPSEAQRSEILAQMNRVSDGLTIGDDGIVRADDTVVSDCNLGE